MTYDNGAVFKALSDPSRRSIVERLSARPMTVREITDGMTISQPAVSQHLDHLRRSGLVMVEPRGASNVYSIDPRGLGVVRAWLDRYWTKALDNYAKLFETDGE